MNYELAIPSYKRHDQIITKTLKTLERQGVPGDKITVFVANEEEYALYKKAIPEGSVKAIVIGVVGLVPQCAFIERYYPEGTYLVRMDDDVERIMIATSKTTKEDFNLPEFFERAFKRMEEEEVSIWGIGAVDNPFFAFSAPEVSTSLKYLVGVLYGQKVGSSPVPLKGHGGVEDKERTLYFFKLEGKTLRFNRIFPKTKYFGKGGLESPDRKQKHDENTTALVEQYPEWATKIVRKNGYADVRFKTTRAQVKNIKN
jgi:hypothetical protein